MVMMMMMFVCVCLRPVSQIYVKMFKSKTFPSPHAVLEVTARRLCHKSFNTSALDA